MRIALPLLFLLLAGAPLGAQPVPAAVPSASPAPGWTDWADLALASDVVIVATLSSIDRLSKREAPDVPEGEVRAVVRGDLAAALKAPGVLPAEAAWRWQGRAGPRGRTPFATKQRVLLFATPLAGGRDPSVYALQLATPDGQQPWTAEAEAVVRDVLRQALAPGARGLMVTGLRDAFRSEGDVPGSSESQFFLKTEGGQPLALLVRRAPGEPPEVLAASGDLVDRAAAIAPRTLLWRGLACGMPQRLPPALRGDPGLVADFAAARAAIGPCGRTLGAGVARPAPAQSDESRMPTERASG